MAANEVFKFALTPGQIDNKELINYNSKTGVAHWKAATKPLRKDSQLYDCTPDGFHQFLKSIKVRADSYGWSKSGGSSGLHQIPKRARRPT